MNSKEVAEILNKYLNHTENVEEVMPDPITREAIKKAADLMEASGTDDEYAAFAWNPETEKYEMVGRPVITELLCRNRFKEAVRNGWAPKNLDCKDVVFKKRKIITIAEDWEEIKEDM